MIESGARALLDAVVGITAELSVPEVLRRTVDSARELVDAEHGDLIPAGDDLPADAEALSVVIRVRDEVFGHLVLTGKRDGAAFTERDEERIATLAAAAGAAIGNATRFEQTLRRERWWEASHQVTAALLTGEDSASTLHLIAERARCVSGASAGAIALPREDDPSTLVFEVVASPDPEHGTLAGVTVPAENTATGVAFTTGEPVVVRQYGDRVVEQQAGTNVVVPGSVKDLDSAVAVPLIVGAEKLGVLVVAKFGDKAPFTDAEVDLVRDFAAHAAMAVEFARAEHDRRRLAVFEDRDRIARDLHDLVIQRLFAVGLGLEGLSRLATQPEVADQVRSFVHDLDQTIRDVRNSIFSLQQPADAGGSVRSELLRLARDSLGLLGFEPRISFDGPLDTAVTGPVRADLIATVRESLATVARHDAAAVTVKVVVDQTGQRLTVTVADDRGTNLEWTAGLK